MTDTNAPVVDDLRAAGEAYAAAGSFADGARAVLFAEVRRARDAGMSLGAIASTAGIRKSFVQKIVGRDPDDEEGGPDVGAPQG